MGIFSFGKKDDAPSRRGADAGSGRRSSQNARVVRRSSRRPDRSGDADAMLLDPTLPEKQRARRRLVGAIALVVAAIVILPMVLDSHPKPVTDDIAIDIPSRPAEKTAPRDDSSDAEAGVAPDNGPAAASGVATPGVTTPGASGLAAAAPGAQTPPAPSAQAATQSAQHTPAAPARTAQSAQSDTSTKTAQASARSRAPSASASGKPAAALASRGAQPASGTTMNTDVAATGDNADADAGTPAAPPGSRFALRLGVFPDDASARPWVAKLKAAGVPAYTERSKQADGSTRTLLRAGPFPDRAAASEAIAKMRNAGLTSGANGGGVE